MMHRVRDIRPQAAAVFVFRLVAISVAAILLSVWFTPQQSVTAAGQTINVGASASFSASGPAQWDAFGETVSTRLIFVGPIRPTIRWAHLNQNDNFDHAVAQQAAHGARENVTAKFVDGFREYYSAQTKNALLCALLIAVVVGLLLVLSGESLAVGLALLSLSMALTFVSSYGSVALTSRTMSEIPRLDSFEALVGRSSLRVSQINLTPKTTEANVVVIGDSTAAGAGNSPLPHPTKLDTLCERSRDAYAEDLQSPQWKVLNLACAGARISTGLFTAQLRRGNTMPSQLALLDQVNGVSVVIVSVGANEMNWSVTAGACLFLGACDDKVSAALFANNLTQETFDVADLYGELAKLPSHPRVLINLYYNPFSPAVNCAKGSVSDSDWSKRVTLLSDRLRAFNNMLARGAENYGFTAVQPDFSGHELCTTQPYVLPSDSQAPLHPNAGGEQEIAIADLKALSAVTIVTTSKEANGATTPPEPGATN